MTPHPRKDHPVTDVEKLIEELDDLLGKWASASYWARDAERDSIRATILSALRENAALRRMVEAGEGMRTALIRNAESHESIAGVMSIRLDSQCGRMAQLTEQGMSAVEAQSVKYAKEARDAISAYDAAKEAQ